MEELRIRKPRGATKRKKMLGRGAGSGHGCTTGKGTKGQNSRSGGVTRLGFEGGQMPLFRRVARRGFSNHRFKKLYQTVKIAQLSLFGDGDHVDAEALAAKGVLKNPKLLVKILGNGELSKKLKVQVDKLTSAARQKILKAGGEVLEKGKKGKVAKNGSESNS